jgi:D-alanine-D-alanine ligase-like ATP-grasp enzyme
MKKLRVAVLYGGRSGEHEVSLQSAASVINYLDRDRFEIIPVAIDKQGRWHLNDISLLEGKVSARFQRRAEGRASAKSRRHRQRQRVDLLG